MKKTIAVLVCLVLCALPLHAAWFTEGKKSSPSDNTLLADSGALTAQEWQVTILISSTIAAKVRIQHRNAANTGNIAQHEVSVGGSAPYNTPILRIQVADNERIRVVTEGVILGDVQASLFL